MKFFPGVENISPEQFERQVKTWLESVSPPLESFTATHLEQISGMDGEFKIDVTARFKALGGANFLVVVECKKHKNPIKRDVVQVLRAKQISLGAQKAIVVSTSDFQSGAREFAQRHGIGLVRIINGAAAYVQANALKRHIEIPDDAEDYAGLFYDPNPILMPQPFTAEKNYGLSDYLLGE